MSLKRFHWVMELPDPPYNDVAGETVMDVTTVFHDEITSLTGQMSVM
jgi:hypothetical protein